MKRILTFSSFLLLIILFAISCGPSATEKEQARIRRSKIPNPITWDTIVLSKVEPLDVKGIKASASLNVNFIVPKLYENEAILEKIKSEISYEIVGDDQPYAKLEAKEALNKYMAEYLADYKKEAKTQLKTWNKINGTEIFSYVKDLEAKVLYNEANLISYQISSIEKGGGDTIPTTVVQNMLIDLTNGKILKEEDIFVDGYKEKLNAILIKQILKDNKLKDIEELQARGYWGVADIAVNNNFYVTRDGITYTFNPDEYADAELGVLKVFIDFEDLEDILKENSPISILAQE